MRKSSLLLLPLLALLLFPGAALSNTLYVGPNPATGGSNCSAPDYNDIQPAVDAAANGDTILICLSGTPYRGEVTTGWNKSLTFQGQGTAYTIIDGAGKRFGFNGVTDRTLTFKDMTIRNTTGGSGAGISAGGPLILDNVVIDNAAGGSDLGGGALDVNGTLTMSNSRVEDSKGTNGAISAGGEVHLTNSVVRNNYTYGDGGGITVLSGDIYIDNSTISGNRTGTPSLGAYGGGIEAMNAGTVRIRNSTFANNYASARGGAVHASKAIVSNSTFWNNNAGQGSAILAEGSGGINILNSTVVDNPSDRGALVTYDANIIVANSILAQNGTVCRVEYNQRHGIYSGGGNAMTNDTTGCDWLVDAKVTRAALALSNLADNGGPTETMALGSTSVAIGAAGEDTNCPGLDQRGYARPPGQCDSGAFELNATPPIARYQMTVVRDGGGGGRVRSDAGAIDCGERCTEDYVQSTVVSLSAQANIGSDFAGWSGGCTGADEVCVVTMDQAKEVVAKFVISDWLRASTSGDGNGVVTSDPGGIDCGEICDAEYSGEVVQLYATPEPDSIFTGWSGACDGVEECLIDFSETSQASVDANFALKANRRPALDKLATGRIVGVKVNVACAVVDTCTVRLSGNRKSHPKQSFRTTNVDATIDGTTVFVETTQTMRKAIRRAWRAGKNPIALLNAQQVDGGRRSISFLIKKR